MFTLIVGPMKSGKSAEFLAQTQPFKYAEKEVLFVQPEKNTRDQGIQSRLGISATALVVRSLREVSQPFDVIGIDEVHMFDEDDAQMVEQWRHEKKHIIISGLDIDYQRKMFPIIQRLRELKPDETIEKTAFCDVCKDDSRNAQFTQIVDNGIPVLGGIEAVNIDDGSREYQARCFDCFEVE
jgi:thymidine kinase